ncbi:SDR family oxidoreductase [Arthrobacter sp. W4I7]|uniref:SDR family oxidoreductase n=1 Tax=Arthrobacter sp. W4I7 TaxID=3042296 RepID=UPI002782E2CC|nr:SDR family oxidoreductase [Arthrobacter sp. W4I7]MDQ0691446.1 NAD(P)-dependent dehydrogenase (short-subunit alcohol dehydrogenase family) [Arthrobacter sp. W4I7]
MSKVWFVTGASKGFGREFVLAALERGDKVAATARNTDTLDDLVEKYGDAVLPLKLDVADRDQAFAAVKTTHEAFGCLDVVINNAGYGLFGTVEEVSEQQLRDQLETNVFGVFHVTQAVLPILREQGSGHIIQISTIGGVAAFPGLGGYHASKWALEGLTESLAGEVAGFNIKVTLVEPGGFDTDWSGASAVFAESQPQYAPLHEGMAAQMAGNISPKPVGFGSAILKVVDAEKAPLRVFFGDQPLQIASYLYQQRLDQWNEWAPVSREAEGK